MFSSGGPSVRFLTRYDGEGGDRDLGVAFQTHPGRQAFISSGSKEPRSIISSENIVFTN